MINVFQERRKHNHNKRKIGREGGGGGGRRIRKLRHLCQGNFLQKSIDKKSTGSLEQQTTQLSEPREQGT